MDVGPEGHIYVGGRDRNNEPDWPGRVASEYSYALAFLASFNADGEFLWSRPGFNLDGMLEHQRSERHSMVVHEIVAHGNRLYTNEGLHVLILGGDWGTRGGVMTGVYSLGGDSLATLFFGQRDSTAQIIDLLEPAGFIRGLELDAAGNLYIAGKFQDTLRVGPGAVLLPREPGGRIEEHVALVSYTPGGELRWAHRIAGTRTQREGEERITRGEEIKRLFHGRRFGQRPPVRLLPGGYRVRRRATRQCAVYRECQSGSSIRCRRGPAMGTDHDRAGRVRKDLSVDFGCRQHGRLCRPLAQPPGRAVSLLPIRRHHVCSAAARRSQCAGQTRRGWLHRLGAADRKRKGLRGYHGSGDGQPGPRLRGRLSLGTMAQGGGPAVRQRAQNSTVFGENRLRPSLRCKRPVGSGPVCAWCRRSPTGSMPIALGESDELYVAGYMENIRDR